jgi:hypothetical protein
MKAARSVELAAYNTFQPETSTTYKQKMRSLFQNLKIKNNEQLRADVFSGVITPEKFGKSDEGDIKTFICGFRFELYANETNSQHVWRRPQVCREARRRRGHGEGEHARGHDRYRNEGHLNNVRIDELSLPAPSSPPPQRQTTERDPIPRPRLLCEWVRYGVFIAFNKKLP